MATLYRQKDGVLLYVGVFLKRGFSLASPK